MLIGKRPSELIVGDIVYIRSRVEYEIRFYLTFSKAPCRQQKLRCMNVAWKGTARQPWR